MQAGTGIEHAVFRSQRPCVRGSPSTRWVSTAPSSATSFCHIFLGIPSIVAVRAASLLGLVPPGLFGLTLADVVTLAIVISYVVSARLARRRDGYFIGFVRGRGSLHCHGPSRSRSSSRAGHSSFSATPSTRSARPRSCATCCTCSSGRHGSSSARSLAFRCARERGVVWRRLSWRASMLSFCSVVVSRPDRCRQRHCGGSRARQRHFTPVSPRASS